MGLWAQGFRLIVNNNLIIFCWLFWDLFLFFIDYIFNIGIVCWNVDLVVHFLALP